MKASLHLKASQHLAMTPQLQQSIRLLQLSSVELQQEVAQALAENPMLERDEGATTNNEEATDTADASEQTNPIELDEGYSSTGGHRGDGFEHEPADAATLTLREHLLAQAGLLRITWREQALVRILIEALDERGYLSSTLPDILDTLPEDEVVSMHELDIALSRLQELDPPGVGARSLEECLSLQLRESNEPAAPLARTLVTEYLPLLAQRDFTQLRRKTGADDDQLRDAQALIRTLNPHPGDAFIDNASPYIIPDVLVRRAEDTQAGWQATINPDALPRLKINRLYSDLLHSSGVGEGHEGLGGQLQEARWLIKNIQQRFETIARVAQAIVHEQAEFFEKGELAMRPLVLREIADRLGLHESTISRVTTQKFMATPRGVLEFKYFFGSHVGTDDGGATSATAIKARIRQLIGEENPKKPLSDQQICNQFSAGGIVVARRTIAKYREALGIPTASLRKAL